MNREERRRAIRARMAEQIEIIAQALCEGKNPVAAERVLIALEAQFASEDIRPPEDISAPEE